MPYVIYNDFHLVPLYIMGVVTYFYTLFSMIYFHELGHHIYFWRNKIKTKSKWIWGGIENFGVTTQYNTYVTDDQHRIALWMGILFGMFPMAITVYFNPMSVLMIAPYILCCVSDFKQINKIYEKKGEHFLGLDDD